MTLEELEAWFAALKRHGVEAFTRGDNGESFSVKFAPSAAPEATAPSAEDLTALRNVLEPETCACGHPEYAHQSGLCIHGCPAEKCAPQADDQPAEEGEIVD